MYIIECLVSFTQYYDCKVLPYWRLELWFLGFHYCIGSIYVYITIYLSSLLLMSTCALFSFWLLSVNILKQSNDKHVCTFLLDINLRVELLGLRRCAVEQFFKAVPSDIFLCVCMWRRGSYLWLSRYKLGFQ